VHFCAAICLAGSDGRFRDDERTTKTRTRTTCTTKNEELQALLRGDTLKTATRVPRAFSRKFHSPARGQQNKSRRRLHYIACSISADEDEDRETALRSTGLSGERSYVKIESVYQTLMNNCLEHETQGENVEKKREEMLQNMRAIFLLCSFSFAILIITKHKRYLDVIYI